MTGGLPTQHAVLITIQVAIPIGKREATKTIHIFVQNTSSPKHLLVALTY